MLAAGDALVIAGKGHETGQIVGDSNAAVFGSRSRPRGAEGRGMSGPLWTRGGTGARCSARPRARRSSAAIGGVSIDTRTLEPGDLFFAIKGETSDGHDHVARAFAAGARRRVVDRAAGANARPRPAFRRRRHLARAWSGSASPRARATGARIVAVTGSVGKTSAKEMLRVALGASGPTHASAASYNNHWGVPLTLARMPSDALSASSRSA